MLRRHPRTSMVDPKTGKFIEFWIEGILPTDNPLEGMQQWNIFYRLDGAVHQVIQHGAEFHARHPLAGVYTGKNCVMLGDVASVPLALPDGSILLYILVWYGFLGIFVTSQLYRYHSVSNAVERQQTKWIVFGVTGTYLIELGITVWYAFFSSPLPNGSLGDLILTPLGNAVPILIPLSFGFAILRYRLWEIDVIIKRTLVYATLTAMLALVYFGLVLALQSLVRALTGQVSQSSLVLVASTLAIAGLFQPLRHRIQAIGIKQAAHHRPIALVGAHQLIAHLRL